MSATEYRFIGPTPGTRFRLGPSGTKYGPGPYVNSGDTVALTDAMAERIRADYGKGALVPVGMVHVDADTSEALAAARLDALLWERRARALAGAPDAMRAAAVAVGAPKNAPLGTVRRHLLGPVVDPAATVAALDRVIAIDDSDPGAVTVEIERLRGELHGARAAADREGLSPTARVRTAIARAGFEPHARRLQLARALGHEGNADPKAFLLDVLGKVASGGFHVTADRAAAVDAVVAGWRAAAEVASE